MGQQVELTNGGRPASARGVDYATLSAPLATGDALSLNVHEPPPPSSATRWLQALCVSTIFPLVYGFNWLFHNKYCGFLFQCGCTWQFTNGWRDCNVHNKTGPKCP
jgi:hypothetical protein